MKILFVTLGFLPAVHWGGPVKTVYQNAQELRRRGYTVTVCASNLLDKRRRLGRGSLARQMEGLRVLYLNTYAIPRWPGTLGPSLLSHRAVGLLRGEVARHDLIHINGTRNALVVNATRAAGRQNKAVVLQPHGTLPHIVSSIHLKRLFDRLCLSRMFANVDRFIALQESEAEQIIAAGGPPERIRIVPNGLRPVTATDGRGPAFRARYGLPAGDPVVLFLGRINRKKGTDLLVEAFARLPRETRDSARLVIAGPDDGQLAEVRQLVRRHRLEERVTFTGLLQDQEVAAAFAAADLFILPCRTDTFPMAIIEACQAGTPILVTEGCEIAALLAGRAASVVPVEVAAIATAMEQLLADPGLREHHRQGAAGLMRTAFSMMAVGDRLEAVYAEALQFRSQRK